MTQPLRVCLIASSRFPVAEPFAGGLEAHSHGLARELTRRGYAVTLFAAPGSDSSLNVHELAVDTFVPSATARADVGAGPAQWIQEHHAYLGLMLDLARHGSRRFDVIHNNSLHHLPVAMASSLEVPFVTTLHTPPVPWLESAIAYAPKSAAFASVSAFTARSWSHVTPSTVVLNGVDTDRWQVGCGGGGSAVWFGRLVPEKGAHLAIDAAAIAGVPLDLAGPIFDPEYFAHHIRPRLSPTVRYLGHLCHQQLVEVVGRASVALVTPVWDEPYGLVAAEAIACGTPVAGFHRGALPEFVTESTGILVTPDDVRALAAAIPSAQALPRHGLRTYALDNLSRERMVDEYESLYDHVVTNYCAA
ncbi:MAG: glycosyltransferase family 4 protein [Nocardioidaceae bacterium]|nr:glycosyltransferase family 4 protein [Nocardioidaceae bacterium]